MEEKAWAVEEVPPPEFPRFLHEAVDPLKTRAPDPVGAARHCAGDKGERGSDPDGGGDVEPL